MTVRCAKEGCKNTTSIDPNDPNHDYKLAAGWDLTTDDLQLSVIDLSRGDVRVRFWCPSDQPPKPPISGEVATAYDRRIS